VLNGLMWLSCEISGGSSEHCNEPSGFIKGAEFLEYLSIYWFPMEVLFSVEFSHRTLRHFTQGAMMVASPHYIDLVV
jgi:hypothetical protein